MSELKEEMLKAQPGLPVGKGEWSGLWFTSGFEVMFGFLDVFRGLYRRDWFDDFFQVSVSTF